jgi:hypothetical protein
MSRNRRSSVPSGTKFATTSPITRVLSVFITNLQLVGSPISFPSWENLDSNIQLHGGHVLIAALVSANLRFGVGYHDETSFYEQGAFHESFITKPLALVSKRNKMGRAKDGSGLVLPARTFHGGIPTTKRLSCHRRPVRTVHSCRYRSHDTLCDCARFQSINMRCVHAVWMPS